MAVFAEKWPFWRFGPQIWTFWRSKSGEARVRFWDGPQIWRSAQNLGDTKIEVWPEIGVRSDFGMDPKFGGQLKIWSDTKIWVWPKIEVGPNLGVPQILGLASFFGWTPILRMAQNLRSDFGKGVHFCKSYRVSLSSKCPKFCKKGWVLGVLSTPKLAIFEGSGNFNHVILLCRNSDPNFGGLETLITLYCYVGSHQNLDFFSKFPFFRGVKKPKVVEGGNFDSKT